LRERKDAGHGRAQPADHQQREMTMRIFDRLRERLGNLRPEHQTDSKTAHTDDSVPYSAVEIESMCCGHCSGNAEAHLAELPNAR